MSVQLVGSGDGVDVRIIPIGPFEGGTQVRGLVPPGDPEIEERLMVARFACQKGGPSRTGQDCLVCDHYRGWRDGPGLSEVTISCAWTDRAPVSARMTRAPAVVTVPMGATCGEADELAQSHGLHHLLVTKGDHLVGVVCRCDLRKHATKVPIAEFLSKNVFAIRHDASLGEAAGALADLRIGCLPVLDGDLLVGVITRNDLLRAGVPAALLGAPVCAACGSTHGVSSAKYGNVGFCIECRERIDAAELQGGD